MLLRHRPTRLGLGLGVQSHLWLIMCIRVVFSLGLPLRGRGDKVFSEVLTSLGDNGFAGPINPKVRRPGVDKWQTSLIHAKASNRRRTWFGIRNSKNALR
jgi:hypothetical protein